MSSPRNEHDQESHPGRDLSRVSVIIPVFNVAPYLREALDSVIHQTYDHLEIIIVDDGSTDGSETICNDYRSDPRVRVIHQRNQGLSSARNAGLDCATGEYIAFLDSDDAYHPDFIQIMSAALKNADISVCQYTIHHRTLGTRGHAALKAREGFYNREEALRALLDGKINVSVWNKLYRKELWNHIRFPDGHNYEDIDTIYRVFDLCNQLFYLDQPLFLHRKRPGSITQTASRKNTEDRNLSYTHLEAFVNTHIPGIFTEQHLWKARQLRLNGMIVSYINGYMDAAEIKAIYSGLKGHECSIKFKVAFQLIRICPRLLKIIYPVYRSSKMLMRKVFRR